MQLDTRIGEANAVLPEFYRSVVTKRELSNTAKLLVFKSVFDPILTCGDESWIMTRASFCCSNKARKLHLFSAKVAFMRCKLHLCAHLTVNDLKQPILHAKIEKVAKSNMQKSKKLQKVAI